jgi:hypothetical protein
LLKVTLSFSLEIGEVGTKTHSFLKPEIAHSNRKLLTFKDAKAEEVLRRLQLTNNIRQTMANIRLALAEEESQGKSWCRCHKTFYDRKI